VDAMGEYILPPMGREWGGDDVRYVVIINSGQLFVQQQSGLFINYYFYVFSL
jgi:hypothetical protein